MHPVADELLKSARKKEEYEATLKTIYDNVRRSTAEPFLRLCIMSAIEGVWPENRRHELDDL